MYTPPGNQPPYGNQPQYNQPGGFVPANQQRPGTGGCWLWGGLGCLILVLFIGGLIAYSAYTFTHGKTGKSFASAMSSAKTMSASVVKGKAVTSALARYKADNGHYPASLRDLIPKYLPDASALHTPSDPNTDPSHVSFDYKQPASGAPGSTVLISFHNPMELNMMGTDQKIDQKVNIEINGNETIDSTQTMTMPDGKSVTSSSHVDMSTGKTSTSTPGMPGSTSGSSSP